MHPQCLVETHLNGHLQANPVFTLTLVILSELERFTTSVSKVLTEIHLFLLCIHTHTNYLSKCTYSQLEKKI